jgi:hypothetical protein
MIILEQMQMRFVAKALKLEVPSRFKIVCR